MNYPLQNAFQKNPKFEQKKGRKQILAARDGNSVLQSAHSLTTSK